MYEKLDEMYPPSRMQVLALCISDNCSLKKVAFAISLLVLGSSSFFFSPLTTVSVGLALFAINVIIYQM